MRYFLYVLLSFGLVAGTALKVSAGEEVVVIDRLQYTRTLGGVVTATDGSPLANVIVTEVATDWKTELRSTTTDANGRWTLPNTPHDAVHYLRFTTNQCCFNEVRTTVKVSTRKGKELRIPLPLST